MLESSRKRVALVLAATVLLAGCLGGLTGSDAVTPREYPDRPPTVDEETAGPYEATYFVNRTTTERRPSTPSQ